MSTITLSEFKRKHPKLAEVADHCARTIDRKSIQRSAGVDVFPESLLELACETASTERRNAQVGRVRTASLGRFRPHSA